jgi:hypothetical protein
MSNSYYVYEYLRKDGSPYYVGKGKDKRAWCSHKRSNGTDLLPKDTQRIKIVKDNLTEKEALNYEEKLIEHYGIKSEGGLLRNLTYGGEGRTPTEELRNLMSQRRKGLNKGKKKPPRSKEHAEKITMKIKGRPNPKVSQALKGRKQSLHSNNKRATSNAEWYIKFPKKAKEKADNTWKARFDKDYEKYLHAIQLLSENYEIQKAAELAKLHRGTVSKLKNKTHGIFRFYPDLANRLAE